jgi:hypothetical protein
MKFQNEFQVSCSAIHKIIAKPKTKTETNDFGLSKTCATYVHEWMKSQPEFFGRKAFQIGNKYCEKGNFCEDGSIEFAGRLLNWPSNTVKNTTRLSNGWLHGECDVELEQSIIDIKNSWSEQTFPLFETEIPVVGYWAQLQGYMHLWDKPHAELVYTLMNAPEHLIEREARKKQLELGMEDLEVELYNYIKETMTFDQFPDYLRIKRFETSRNRLFMSGVYSKVVNCREYIESLPELEFDYFF